MQCVRQCTRFVSSQILGTNNSNNLSGMLKSLYVIPSRNIYKLASYENYTKKFMEHNKTIFPPQKPGEEKRPGYVCNMKKDIKYSPLKMWYVACFVRGMTVDEAIKQLSFLNKKGAAIAKEVILEAQNMAADHNIEFKSNLWVAESFATKGMVIKGMRRHAKGRQGIVHYRHCNYFVRLEEGKPPADYYMKNPKSGKELLDEWMDKMQHRKVLNSL
ncbi:PREDICTED: 39S ribosomal protein L22, mitochondrial [Dufourea novaeangliae]|nr:PREDICTED: 39S ribosomal protein L22, mitochondrial [Dufourea novaeangliae]